MRALFVFGTRPAAIKLAPVIEAAREHPGLTPRVCVTGQHRALLDQVREDLALRADHDLDLMVPEQRPEEVIARALTALGPVLRTEAPDQVVVQGDTTTAFAAALAAFHARIPVVHVEAGLRTGDRAAPFPEEANRRLIAQLASLHLAPTEAARRHLLAEGVAPDAVVVTGNTAVDAVRRMAARVRGWPPERFPHVGGLLAGTRRLAVVTAHRRESLPAGLSGVGQAVAALAERYPEADWVLPLHPNPSVRRALVDALPARANVHRLPPLPYPSFVALMQRASLVLTDSGGIQEEAPSLGVPVLVLRDATERPEAVEAGLARVVGTRPEAIVAAACDALDRPPAPIRAGLRDSPFGDGRAAARCVAAMASL